MVLILIHESHLVWWEDINCHEELFLKFTNRDEISDLDILSKIISWYPKYKIKGNEIHLSIYLTLLYKVKYNLYIFESMNILKHLSVKEQLGSSNREA